MLYKEMEQELNKLTKTELIRFCIDEVYARYCDNLNLKFKVELTLKRAKKEERVEIDKKRDEAYQEYTEAAKILKIPKYLDFEATLKKLQTEPYTKTCYKDILDHNKKIDKVLDAMQDLKKPYTTASRKYLELCKKSEELWKNANNI